MTAPEKLKQRGAWYTIGSAAKLMSQSIKDTGELYWKDVFVEAVTSGKLKSITHTQFIDSLPGHLDDEEISWHWEVHETNLRQWFKEYSEIRPAFLFCYPEIIENNEAPAPSDIPWLKETNRKRIVNLATEYYLRQNNPGIKRGWKAEANQAIKKLEGVTNIPLDTITKYSRDGLIKYETSRNNG